MKQRIKINLSELDRIIITDDAAEEDTCRYYITRNIEGGLEVSSNGGEFSIKPRVTNSVWIKAKEY